MTYATRTKTEDEITDQAIAVWMRHRRADPERRPSVSTLELNLRWDGSRWWASIAALPARTPGRWVGAGGPSQASALASLLVKLRGM